MTTYSGATGIAPAGMVATGALGDAPAPTAPPMVGGITAMLRIKVLDPVSGAVLCDDLPHLHQVKLDQVGFQPGATGRSAVGTFEVKLFPPRSPGFKNAKAFYDLLDYGQRLEFYLGDIIAGDPKQSGFIKGITKSFTDYTLSGDDSLGLLLAARTGRTEVFSGTTDALVKFACKPYDLTQGDNFSTGLGAYTNDGTWVTTTDPLTGGPAIAPGTGGDGLLYTTTSHANSKYADCLIEAPFRLVCDSTAAAEAEIGIVAALSDTSNFILGQLLLRYVTSTRYELDMRIWQKSGGTYTAKSTVTGAFALPSNVFAGHLQLTGYQASLNTYLWRLVINGTDVGCFWIQSVAAGAPSGKIGFRSAKANAVRAKSSLYIAGNPTGLAFWTKTAWFQTGRISLGTQSLNQAIPDTTYMDLLQLAATTEGGEYRKNGKAGLNQDTLDFGITVGNDFSAMVRFEEGVNVVDASIEPNWEDFGSVLQSPAGSSQAGSGWLRFNDIGQIQRFGPKGYHVPVPRISDTLAHRLFGQAISSLSSNPGKAKRVVVKRDEWADRVRELDVIELHLPSFGIFHARAKVVGYIFKEGEGTIEFMLDQYPRRLDRVPALDRLLANVQALLTKAPTATDPANPFTTVRENSPTLPVNLWKLRVYATGGQTFADGAIATMAFANVTYDNSNGYSTANNQWTVPVSGWYDTKVVCQLSPPANGAGLYTMGPISIKRVGDANVLSESDPLSLYGPAGLGSNGACIPLVDTIYLNQGDVVFCQITATNAGAGTWTVSGTAPPSSGYITFWTMALTSG